MKRPLLLPLLAVLFLTFSRLSCPEDCESYVDLPLRIANVSTTPLDNRKKEPVRIAPGAQGYLNAYGFRAQMETALVDSLDIDINYECSKGYLAAPISECRIYSLIPIPGGSGSDVSDLFRYVDRSGNVPKYLVLPETAAQIMRDWDLTWGSRFDFLLVTPPADEGWYQFELRLIMQDSSVVSTITDSIYLK